MNVKLLLQSIILACCTFTASAENADSCIQTQRTQEQFQKEFNEFIENTRAYILAKEFIPVDSTHLMSKEQKKTLKAVKELIKENNNKLQLPLEVNYLMGDTANKAYSTVRPIFEDGYFVNKESLELIIPLYNDSLDILQCQWCIKETSNGIRSQIETVVGEYEDSIEHFTGYLVYSTHYGNLHRIYSFKDGECVEIIRNAFGMASSLSINKNGSKGYSFHRNSRNNRRNHSSNRGVLDNNDWRRTMNAMHYLEYQDLIKSKVR